MDRFLQEPNEEQLFILLGDDIGIDDETSTSLHIMEILGIIGGTAIALSLAPQVWKTYKTKSAQDISYFYQGIYMFGLALVNLYAIFEGLWPVYVPALLELTLITLLTAMKIHYDKDKIRRSLQHAAHATLNLSRHGISALDLSRSHRSVLVAKCLVEEDNYPTEASVRDETPEASARDESEMEEGNIQGDDDDQGSVDSMHSC